MKTRIISTTAAVLILLAGCGKKTSSSGGSSSPAAAPVIQPVMTAWQQGDKSTAVSKFFATDWSARPLFAPDSALSLTESEFGSLPANDAQLKESKEMLPQLASLKQLAAAVIQAGREAAAKGDLTQARKYFTASKQFGAALDSPDYTHIVQLVGQAIGKMADTELAKIGQ